MEIVSHVNASRHQEHFEAVERYWQRLGGRPHWGKVTYRSERVIENYPAASANEFRAVRREMDPDQVFLNEYVRNILHVEDV